MKRHPKGKGCWYHTTWIYCVLCGRRETLRKRRWGRKPKDPTKRYEQIDTACDSHFL